MYVEELASYLRNFLLGEVQWTYGLSIESRLLTAGGLGLLSKYDPDVEGRISDLFRVDSHQ
jgi:hypothetical protein